MHKSQLPQTPSPNTLTDQERAAIRRARRGRTLAALGSVGALALMLFNAGCPGAEDMDTPVAGSGPGGGSGGAAGGSGGGSNSSACEVQCVTDIFTKDVGDCKLCHSNMPTNQLGGLDLQTPGYTARMKNVPATFKDLSPMGTTPQSAGCPTGALLIDTTYPGSSWLWTKLKAMEGTCGDPMPQVPPMLDAAQMTCMQTYIECVADNKPITTVKPGGAGGSGGSGAGGASGGSGGKAGGGGGAGGASGGSGGSGGASGGSGGGGGSGGTN